MYSVEFLKEITDSYNAEFFKKISDSYYYIRSYTNTEIAYAVLVYMWYTKINQMNLELINFEPPAICNMYFERVMYAIHPDT